MIVLKASMGLPTVSSSSISHNVYLISYGASGTLGCFVSSENAEYYPRGSQVLVRTERGKESGTVLCVSSPRALPVELQYHPGEILGAYLQQEASDLKRLNTLGQEVFNTASQLIKELFLPINLIDVETICDPDTVVLHLLQFGQVELNTLQTELTKRHQVQVKIHNMTNPAALKETTETGCGSCGSGGGCREGGCSSDGCGSCGGSDSPQKFQDDWRNYFSELRQGMENRHE